MGISVEINIASVEGKEIEICDACAFKAFEKAVACGIIKFGEKETKKIKVPSVKAKKNKITSLEDLFAQNRRLSK